MLAGAKGDTGASMVLQAQLVLKVTQVATGTTGATGAKGENWRQR
ncbi:MAG: hypothetical protein ACLR5N_06310 [Haemophilus parainfluenzae]